MKYNVILLMILFPVFALAQTAPEPDSLARETLRELQETWALGIDSTSEAVDIRIYNRFKTLFKLDATVDDAFAVFYQYEGEKASGYKTGSRQKTFDEYTHDVALQVKGIQLDNFKVIRASASDPKNMIYTVALQAAFQKTRRYVLPPDYVPQVIGSRRKIRFDSEADSVQAALALEEQIRKTRDSVYRFWLTDTLQIVMAFEMDTISIRSIRSEATRVTCINDADGDAVLNQEDSLSTVVGDFTALGLPDYDLDGFSNDKDKCPTTYSTTNQGCPPSYFITRNEFTVFIGGQMNSHDITLPELNGLGYTDPSGADAMDVLQSKKGVLKNPGQVPGFFAGASLTHFFGQERKRKGISVGFTYAKFAADYELTDPIVYTYKATDGTNFYRRQVTISSLKEEMDYTVLNIPVILNYRFYLNKQTKTVMNLRVGPSFMFFSNRSSYDAVIDFGGLYQIDTVLKNRITYYDLFNAGSKYNVLLTSAAIYASNPANMNAADSVFRQLAAKNYDFANNENHRGTQAISRSAIAFNANVDVQHKISEGLTIKAGVHYLYAPSLKANEKYKPIDKTSDEFRSIFNSNAKPGYRAIGLALGFVFNF